MYCSNITKLTGARNKIPFNITKTGGYKLWELQEWWKQIPIST